MSRVLDRVEWTQYVHDGRAFAFGASVTGVASVFNLIQLWNPLGSGIRVVIFQAEVGVAGTCITTLALDSVQNPVGGPSTVQTNLLPGSPVLSKVSVTTSQPAALPATGLIIRQSNAAANTKDDVQHPGSICELTEGRGFNLSTGTVNVTSTFGLWWAEIPAGAYP